RNRSRARLPKSSATTFRERFQDPGWRPGMAPNPEISSGLRLRPRRHDPEGAAFLQPAGTFVAQQGAANLAGIVARARAHDLETLGMLVSAEPVGEKVAHAVGDGLRRGALVEFDDGVDAL